MSSSCRPLISVEPEPTANLGSETVPRTVRLAILTNMIPPYRRPVLACLSKQYAHVRILVSTCVEPNRSWGLQWDGLDVVLQKTVTLRGKWRHPQGFEEPLFIHIPVDTVAQLKRFDADVVLSAEMGVRTLLSLIYRRIRRRSKLIIWAELSESSELGRGRLRRILRSILARSVDGFIVYGNSGARYVRGLNVPADRIFKIPYSTDVSRFAQNVLKPKKEHARRLLYVGQLIERKGLQPFIAALSKWASAHPGREVEFRLAGDGPLLGVLKQVSCPPNLKIHLLGNIGYEDLPQIYAEADVLVFPTLTDPWGLVVNEALASGLPVLGSVYSQAVEMLVADGQNGWTFKPDEAGQTWAAIESCMNTPADALNPMREYARSVAVQQSPEYVAALIDRAVMACLGRNESEPGDAANVC